MKLLLILTFLCVSVSYSSGASLEEGKVATSPIEIPSITEEEKPTEVKLDNYLQKGNWYKELRKIIFWTQKAEDKIREINTRTNVLETKMDIAATKFKIIEARLKALEK